MKKFIFILFTISFVLFGCANPTNDDSIFQELPPVEKPTEETPKDTPSSDTPVVEEHPEDNGNGDEPANQPQPTPESENGDGDNSSEESEETGNSDESSEENGDSTSEEDPSSESTNDEENQTTEETPSTSTPTPEETPTTENDNGNNGGTTEETPSTSNEEPSNTTPTEPVNTTPTYERPNLVFADNFSNCDLDSGFRVNVTNYQANDINLRVFATVDGTTPNVISGMGAGNSSTHELNLIQINRFYNFSEISNNAESVTVKAIAYYAVYVNGQWVIESSDVVEKTYTISRYTVTYQSDLAYSGMPSNYSTQKRQYTFPSTCSFYPDVRGYWFSHYEVNGVRYELGSSFTIDRNTTIKYCWKEWSYPWYEESDVPSGYTKIQSVRGTLSDINYDTYQAYRVISGSYVYTFMIQKSTIQKKTSGGRSYTYASGILKKNALGTGNTVGRQLGSYDLTYGGNSSDVLSARIKKPGTGNQVNITMYTNLNENATNSRPVEIYVNLADLRSINF